MEEGRQIDQEVCGEFERAGDMVQICFASSVMTSGYAARGFLQS